MHRALRQDPKPALDAHPFLNIHSASLSGNLGLVAYALNAGVSPSSVLDGLTPLHAACAGPSDNETVVRLLIDRGADVNAQRSALTVRRGSSQERNRLVGGVGYTPLHFVASAGHISLVPLLLSAGADPNIIDKHGLTPLEVAKQNGNAEIEAALLEALNQRIFNAPLDPPQSAPPTLTSTSKRLLVKKSLDNVFHHRRNASPSFSHLNNQPPPPSPTFSPFGTYTQTFVSSPSPSDFYDTRRPSLPQNLQAQANARMEMLQSYDSSKPDSPITPSLTQYSRPPLTPDRDPTLDMPSQSNNLPALMPPKQKKSNRPRSAGDGSGASRRLASKYSFMNLLKRNPDEPVTPPPVFPDPYTQTAPASQTSFFPPTPPLLDKLSDVNGLSVTPPPQSPTITRPGILRTLHGRTTSSSNSSVPSNEVSRKTSVRTLRFEEANNNLPSEVRKSSESDLGTITGRNRSNSRESDEKEAVDTLQKLAFVNATRARAGTSSSILSDNISASRSSNSPSIPNTDLPAYNTSGLSSPQTQLIDDIESAPDYCSDFSDDECDRSQDGDEGSERNRVEEEASTSEDDLAEPINWSSPTFSNAPGSPQFQVRTHKDAQNLVQQVQREILQNDGEGEVSLSEQLAAYGETLAIERRFAKGEKRRQVENTGVVADESGSVIGADAKQDLNETTKDAQDTAKAEADVEKGSEGGVKRSSSGGHAGRGGKRRPKPLGRPHTSNGVVGREDVPSPRSPRRMGYSDFSPSHISSRSATLPLVLQTLEKQRPGIEITKTLPTPTDSIGTGSPATLELKSPRSPFNHYSPPPSPRRPSHGNGKSPPRISPAPARTTPRTEKEKEELEASCRIAAAPLPTAESMAKSRAPSRSIVSNIPLSRTTSHPVGGSPKNVPMDPIPSQAPPDPALARARNMSSTPKLARMGFTPDPFTLASTTFDAGAKEKKRFGGIKNLMQSIKGRS